MEERFVDAQKDAKEKEELLVSLTDIKLVEEDCSEYDGSNITRSLGVKTGQQLTFDVQKSQNSEKPIQKSFLRSCHGTCKHVRFVSLNEKYLQHCLNLVEVKSSDSRTIACVPASPCNISFNLRSSEMEILLKSLEPLDKRRRNTSDLGSFIVEYPLTSSPENVVITPFGQWILGTTTENANTRNILKSPLFHNLGGLDGNGSIDVKGTDCSYFMNSPSKLCTSSSQKLEKETVPLGDHRYGSKDVVHKRYVSISSTTTSTTCSDHSSSSSTIVSQGMLHCMWNNGNPYFMFSIDDQNEVYVASPRKVVCSHEKGLDYMYLLHSRTSRKKEHGISDNGLDLVAKMKVSSSFMVCPNSSKLRETEFVLFGMKEDCVVGKQGLTPIHRKNRSFPKKVVNMFKTKHVSKHNPIPNFGGSGSIPESFSWEPCQEIFKKVDELGRANPVEGYLPPNLELAAIVVRNYARDRCQETSRGGWGMKFLEKIKMGRTNTSLEASVSSGSFQESCVSDKSGCSTSMNIIVPAGFHGGPRTRNGGPSSLIERWRSGGHCDCGGWDIGCPLTVLTNKSGKEVHLEADELEECKSYDLFVQGGEQGLPFLKMVNIHEDLYIIHFQSTLSPLQSFSIGIATIHTQNPNLFKNSSEFQAERI